MGGGVFSRAGGHEFRHCTFSGNTAAGGTGGTSISAPNAGDGWGQGGAIGSFAGTIKLDHCILYGNEALGSPSGNDEDLFLYSDGPVLSDLGNNMVGVMDAATVFDIASLGNQIGVDPILLPFGDYGGPTDAFMLSACQPISPAIDAGAPLGVTEDQRGELRDANPDIGAIEGPAPVDLQPLTAEVCPGETVPLTLTWSDATTEWPDGSTGNDWNTGPIAGAIANVTTAEGCVEPVTIDVVETAITAPDLGLDFSVCPPTATNPGGTTFDAGNAGVGATYEWTLDGVLAGINPTFLMDVEGALEVTVNVGSCSASDDVVVDWYPAYPLNLGASVTLCSGELVTLDAEVPGWPGVPPVFNWQGGPADAEFEVSSSGTYSVTATTVNNCVSTAQVQVVQSPLTTVDLGADQTICPGSAFVLDPGYPGATCLWQDGTVSNTYNVNTTGIYTVNVTLGECQTNDQVFIEVVTPFDAALPASVNFCDGDSVLLLAAFGASNYTWQNGAVGNQLWASQPGIYEVTSDLDGCTFTDQVNVIPQPLPVFDFGFEIVLCEGESVTLDPGVLGADYVIFNGLLTTPTLEVDESGTYTAEVALGGCTYRDTVEVDVRPIPVFELPEDTVLCPGDVLSLETGLNDVLVTWSTGEVGESLEVNQAQTYTATSQVSGCEFVDSTVVDIALPIAVPLAVDYELCLDDTLMLDASQTSGVYESTYRWDNGSMNPLRILDRAGVFSVEVANVCDTVEHVLEVKQVVCGCQVFVPTAFTPNNDGKNDAWVPFLDCDDMYSYRATVYDRWGRPVFFSDDPDEIWYGQVEGTPGSKTRESGKTYAIDGVYMWEVIVELRRDRIPEVIRQNGYIRVLR
jgi:gliding motility-associated-like protein